MTTNIDIIFVSLAQNQSRFFEAIGKALQHEGFGIIHVCFHEGAVKELRDSGCEVYNPFELIGEDANAIRFEDYAIDNPALLLGHEKAAYEITDTQALIRKFKGHLAAMSKIIEKVEGRGRQLCMVQELGGFTSVLAAYFAARRRGIDNWFIEPSFFRGRVFFTPNSFSAPQVTASNTLPSEEVREIIEEVVKNHSVVIPAKDRLHYRGASKKLLDPKNYKRLFEKLVAKYLRGEREEFQYISGHVKRHLRMFLNSRKLKKHYQSLPGGQPFLYYPLHVPADFALTVRSPEYLDQYTLIDYLCRVAPLGYKIAIKEHPALVGAVSPFRIRELLKKHDNFVLLTPELNNHKVLAASAAVVTVNSKSGAEALLHGKPVIVLGNAFYETCPLVHRVVALSELQKVLFSALNDNADFGSEDALSFFQAVWDASVPGELYDITKSNVDVFALSLKKCISRANG